MQMRNLAFRDMRLPRLGAMQSGGFSPASLFAGGTEGAWFDPSDPSTLFQDSAGTTPVTVSGQPVGLMLDKSGNGNHATQATSSKRPTYTEGGGLSWLAFDGVDDSMRTANGVLNVADVSMLIAISRETESDRSIIALPQYPTIHSDPFFRLMIYTSRRRVIGPRINGVLYNSNITVADNARSIIFASNRKNVQVNGVVAPSDVSPVSLTFPNSVPLIISGNAAGGELHKGNFYGAVGLGGDMNFVEIDSATAYLAAKSGVTL